MDFNTHRFPNGIPRLLDGNGKPFPIDPHTGRVRYTDGRPEASGLAIPHAFTFVAKYGGAQNTYLHEKFDEALRAAREDAEVMRRDAYLMSLLQERKLAVSSLPWHIEVPDDRDPYQRRVRDGLTQIVRAIPNLRRIITWLLEALWYGRYGVQIEWCWGSFIDRPAKDKSSATAALIPGAPSPEADRSPGVKRRCLTVRQAWPVNGDKIGFQYDNTPYILVSGGDVDDLPSVDPIMTTIAQAVTLRGTWRERFLLHRHLMEDVDYFAPEQASAVHGVGIRSKLFWLNWLKLEWLGNITDFFDRVGLGFTEWRYPAGNEAARLEAEKAAQNQSSRTHVLVPVWGESGREALTGVERIEVPTSGSDALSHMIDRIDSQMERYVVGQSGSSRSTASGIGNEAATEFMMSTKDAITSEDAHLLGISMSGSDLDPGILSIIKKYTYPDADFPASFVFGMESPESEKKLQSGRTLVDMGVEIKEDELRSSGGYDKPAEGDKIAQPQQQMPGGGGMSGMPSAPGAMGASDAAMGDPSAPPTGDFVDAMKMARGDTPHRYVWEPLATVLRYAGPVAQDTEHVQAGQKTRWQNRGIVRVSKRGLPLYRWYDPISRQSRIQNVPPGGRRIGKRVVGHGQSSAHGGSASLDVGGRTRSKIAAALSLMFPDGWVRPGGLPALAGLDAGAFVPADVSRDDDDGSLVITLRAPGGRYELSLHPDGVLSMTLPSKDRLQRATSALEAAGVDAVFFGDDAVNLTTKIEPSLPREIRKGNEERRKYRLENADELMAMADDIEPPPDGLISDEENEPDKPDELAGATIPVEPEANVKAEVKPSKFAALSEVVKYLKSTGRTSAAREAAIAYAKRLSGDKNP